MGVELMVSSSREPVRVVLVDDHALVRTGIRLILEREANFTVVGEAGNRYGALDAVKSQQPDVVLLDMDVPGASGLELLPELLRVAREARVLILTDALDTEELREAIRLGAKGLVLKENAAEVLLKAIQKVHQGEVWFDRATLTGLVGESAGKPRDPEAVKTGKLTERERDVICLVTEGLKNRQIAQRLYISESTVRHHLTSVFTKLGIQDRFELIVYAIKRKLGRLPS